MAGIRLAGLWKKTSRDGKEYFEGTLGGGLVRFYFSDRKTSENSPDAALYVVEKSQPQGGQRGGGGGYQQRSPQGQGRHPYAPRNPDQGGEPEDFGI